MNGTADVYLSRARINDANANATKDLGNRYSMHCTLMSLFPKVRKSENGGTRSEFNVLFRVDPPGTSGMVTHSILVQSSIKPDWSRIPDGYLVDVPVVKRVAMERYLLSMPAGSKVSFRMIANPVVKKSRSGKRVPIKDLDGQVQWLASKLQASGIVLCTYPGGVPSVTVETIQVFKSMKESNGDVYESFIHAVEFNGMATVEDASKMLRPVTCGIGPARSFGLGLLTVARIGTS